jgi:hypothetical protein
MSYPSPSTMNMSKGFGELLSYVNTVTYGYFSMLILLAIYVIILIGFYKSNNDFAGGMAVAGFGVFVMALLFWAGGFVNAITLGIAIGLALLGIIVLLMNKKGE